MPFTLKDLRYDKESRGVELAPLDTAPQRDGQEPYLESSVYYTKGRGYYLSIKRVDLERTSIGISMSTMLFTGGKSKLIVPANRFNAKTLDQIAGTAKHRADYEPLKAEVLAMLEQHAQKANVSRTRAALPTMIREAAAAQGVTFETVNADDGRLAYRIDGSTALLTPGEMAERLGVLEAWSNQ